MKGQRWWGLNYEGLVVLAKVWQFVAVLHDCKHHNREHLNRGETLSLVTELLPLKIPAEFHRKLLEAAKPCSLFAAICRLLMITAKQRVHCHTSRALWPKGQLHLVELESWTTSAYILNYLYMLILNYSFADKYACSSRQTLASGHFQGLAGIWHPFLSSKKPRQETFNKAARTLTL